LFDRVAGMAFLLCQISVFPFGKPTYLILRSISAHMMRPMTDIQPRDTLDWVQDGQPMRGHVTEVRLDGICVVMPTNSPSGGPGSTYEVPKANLASVKKCAV
jgi:hypothetical protein